MAVTDQQRAVAALGLIGDVISPQDAWEIIQGPPSGVAKSLLRRSNEAVLMESIADELDMEFVNLDAVGTPYRIDEEVLRRCSLETLNNRVAVPLLDPDNNIVVAMSNPRADGDTIDYLRQVYPEGIRVALGVGTQIMSRLAAFGTRDFSEYADGADTAAETAVTAVAGAGNTSPVVEWLDGLLLRAAAEGVSDIHFMTQEGGELLVRFRLDGILRPVPVPFRRRDGEIIGALLSRCPTIDPTDKTRPQDGAFTFTGPAGRRIDTRLGMLPLVHGPLVVVRLLDPRNVQRRLEDMGFSPYVLSALREGARASQGLILLSGPTGSGKTTTLYGVLNEMDFTTRNVLTAEDPVEYRLAGVGQTQIRSDLGDKSITFAKALRSFLRLDPDVILVGEIRDEDTAEVAMHAALTGHLVLSTIHANSSLGVIQRLEELGGEPFMVAESLSLALSQRLVRVIHECGYLDSPTAAERAFLERLGLPVPERVPRAVGCGACSNTGYKGRQAVLGMFKPNETTRNLVGSRVPLDEVARIAAGNGLYSINEDAFRHVEAGRTTVSEMLRVLDTGKTT